MLLSLLLETPCVQVWNRATLGWQIIFGSGFQGHPEIPLRVTSLVGVRPNPTDFCES